MKNHDIQVKAFRMRLKSGCGEEYRKRHAEIWPEVLELLRISGLVEYRIFLDEETHLLFAIQKRKKEVTVQDPTVDPIMRRWWNRMADIMEVNPDNSPIVVPCREMFVL